MAKPALDILQPTDPRRFGRYSLLYRIASGGMANLYLGRLAGSQGFEKLVAIKRIHDHLAQEKEFIEMLVDEAMIASRISHPNVAQVLELGEDPAHFIAMEYVEGESLTALIRHAQPSLPVCARLIAQAAAGLHGAHELRSLSGEALNVVHRDVSPQNILVSYQGTVKVVDFGVARARGNLHNTQSGIIKGKFAYMSPEQAGMKEIDRRSDIFSLGIVLYEITTRYRLFKAPNEASTLQKILEAEILPPSKLVPGYPAALERIVLRTLSREPQGRYNTAEELQSDLETFIIQSGDPVLPGQVAELMRQTFELRITEKRELIQRCENMPHVTEESALDEDNSLTMGGATASVGAYKRRQKRRWLMIAAITLMVVGLGALGASIPDWLGGGDEFANLQRRRLVRVTIRATPASAEVRIDGRKVTNPYVKDRTSSEGESTVTVSADGYKTRRFDISLAEGGTFIVALSRKEKVRKVPRRPDAGVPDASVADMMPASVPDRGVPRRDMRVKKRRTRPKRHKRRPRPRRQKGLFDNPYG